MIYIHHLQYSIRICLISFQNLFVPSNIDDVPCYYLFLKTFMNHLHINYKVHKIYNYIFTTNMFYISKLKYQRIWYYALFYKNKHLLISCIVWKWSRRICPPIRLASVALPTIATMRCLSARFTILWCKIYLIHSQCLSVWFVISIPLRANKRPNYGYNLPKVYSYRFLFFSM